MWRWNGRHHRDSWGPASLRTVRRVLEPLLELRLFVEVETGRVAGNEALLELCCPKSHTPGWGQA